MPISRTPFGIVDVTELLLVGAGERHRESVLQNIAVNLDSWTVQTKQETAIYHTLNKLSVDTSRKVHHQDHILSTTDAHTLSAFAASASATDLCSCCGARMRMACFVQLLWCHDVNDMFCAAVAMPRCE